MSTIIYSGEAIQLHLLPGSVVELRFDRRQQSINKFDTATVKELEAASAVIRNDPSIKGVLVTSAKTSFIVGADIFEFTSLFAGKAEDVASFIAMQSAVFTAFSDLPIPIATAINGLAFGGGLEMALASDLRVLASGTLVGLPEVSLGLFPGFGGCVRLPRLIGATKALEWIVSGKPQKSDVALSSGAVDAVVPGAQVREAALDLLHIAMQSNGWQSIRRARSGSVDDWNVEDFVTLEGSASKDAVHYPAALAAVQLVRDSVELDRDAALILEARSFGRVATTATAAALIQLFISDQAMKKKAGAYSRIARKVTKAGVVGAGIMGGGIAYTSAVRGVSVKLKDIAQTALNLGMAEAQKLAAKQVASGRMTPEAAAAIDASITPSLDFSGFDTVDTVVEAVVENMKVKQAVLAQIEQEVRPDTVLASNTSSLSITVMAAGLKRPENFAGMHFFNPVPAMPLVEVIRGLRTSDVATATVAAYASAMGKTPVVVKDCPGFLVNRIFTPYVVGFLKLVHDGANFEHVDKVMEEFGWPMGPAYLQDVIGLDTGSHVFDVIIQGYSDRMKLGFKDAIHLLAENKSFGQKNGRGFYRYETNAKGRPVKASSPEAHALIAGIQPAGQVEFRSHEIVDRLMLPMIVEAAVCLMEGVVETAAEVDTSLILGLGFPRYLGGPLKFADQLGIATVLSRCDRLGILNENEIITRHLRKMASVETRFY